MAEIDLGFGLGIPTGAAGRRQRERGVSVGLAYTSALQRWLGQQQRATGLYARAEEPLQETVGMFRRGGGFGAGQISLIEEEAKRSRAGALAEQVRTGMSSSSLATSTRLRSAADVTRAKLGVEDVRTQFLTQALSQLSGLRGTQAGQAATTVEPYTPSYLGAKVSQQGIEAQELASIRDWQLRMRQAKKPRFTTTPEKGAEAPWASMVF